MGGNAFWKDGSFQPEQGTSHGFLPTKAMLVVIMPFSSHGEGHADFKVLLKSFG